MEFNYNPQRVRHSWRVIEKCRAQKATLRHDAWKLLCNEEILKHWGQIKLPLGQNQKENIHYIIPCLDCVRNLERQIQANILWSWQMEDERQLAMHEDFVTHNSCVVTSLHKLLWLIEEKKWGENQVHNTRYSRIVWCNLFLNVRPTGIVIMHTIIPPPPAWTIVDVLFLIAGLYQN